MILAAGFGSRLRPLTDRIPKALVQVGGVAMIERIARRLIGAGVDRLIINIHHHADQIRQFVEERDGFGVEVRFSVEEGAPLETGGGLAHAASHFRSGNPFFLHNVDIITEIDLEEMLTAHQRERPLATLAVSGRDSGRLLRFDPVGLQGRVDVKEGALTEARPARGAVFDRAFAGVHVVSPELPGLLTESGAFSIMKPYMRLAGEGHSILPYDMGDTLWLEIGDPDRLAHARAVMGPGEDEG